MMKRTIRDNFATVAAVALMLLLAYPLATHADLDLRADDEIHLIVGDLETLQVFELTRISVTDPDVADIVDIDNDRVVMLAKKAGKTTLFVWDKYGKRSIILRVFQEDLEVVATRIQNILSKTDIRGIVLEISDTEGKLIASGGLTEEKKAQFDSLVEPFSESVMNLVQQREESGLVQIDAQLVELKETLNKSLGINWTSALTYSETLPTGTIHDAADIFKLGKFARTTQITSVINMLITEGKARLLSQPKIVCVSGKEASFLVGGEVPISTTTTTSGGNVQEDVEFKDYGVELTVNPTIREDNKVDIKLTIDVSDIDATNAVGDNVAFTTRTAETQLYLDNGQTVVLAGLIKSNTSHTISRIPGFSDIPIVGALFRSTSKATPDSDTELVISLTPTILRSDGTPAPVIEPVPAAYAAKVVASASQQDAGTQAVSAAEATQRYVRAVQARIAQGVAYPAQAKQQGWEGTATLALRILPNGTLASAAIVESSGYDAFDNNALYTAHNLAPYAGFPAEMRLPEVTVTIPIVYTFN